MIDVERARRETPGCAHVVHLNNAGSSLPPRQVLEAVIGHIELEGRDRRLRGGATEETRSSALRRGRRLIGARPDEIAFVENATRAWDMAFYALPFEPGDRILTARPSTPATPSPSCRRARARA